MLYFEKEIEEIFTKLEKAESIVIFGHKNPDGDCVGSVEGMKDALLTLFPNKKVYSTGTHPKYLEDLFPSVDDVSLETIHNSLALMVDLSDIDRVEDQRIREAKEIVCIDHHMKQYDLPFPVLRDEKAASATLIIAKCLLKRYGKIPSLNCATYLYIGLITDSGRFQFDSKEETFEVAKELVSCGVDYNHVYSILYSQTSTELKYRSIIYQNFKFSGLVTYVCITKEMYQQLNLTSNEASGKVNLLSLLDNHPMWVTFTEQEDGIIRVELRSDGHYNVQKVALQFNGGGHIPAAGCRLTSFDDVDKVLLAMNNAERV